MAQQFLSLMLPNGGSKYLFVDQYGSSEYAVSSAELELTAGTEPRKVERPCAPQPLRVCCGQGTSAEC